MKMKIDKKLVVLFMGLVLLIVSSLSVSFAWFNSGTELYIEEFYLTVDTDVDLYVAAEPDVEKITDGLTSDDFDNYALLKPVTSAYSEEWLSMKKEMPMFTDHYKNDGKNNERPGYARNGYYTRELYLYSNESMIVTLNSDETKFSTDEKINEETAKKLIESDKTTTGKNRSEKELLEETTNNLNKITDSLRISVLDPDEDSYNYWIFKNEFKSNETETYFGGLLDNDGDGYYDYHYDGNEKYETLFGKYTFVDPNFALSYKPAASSDSNLADPSKNESCFNARTHKDVHALDTSTLEGNVIFDKENALCLDEGNATIDIDNGMQINLHKGEFKKIIVSYYIEGWDLDNTMETCYANFSIKLAFTTYRVLPDIEL